MYIQPYEPQEATYGSRAPAGSPATQACTQDEAPLGSDGVTTTPWRDGSNATGDAAGAFSDAPFGLGGLGAMLTSLTSMLQQIAQMMQSLLGRANADPTGQSQSQNAANGCTQHAMHGRHHTPIEE
jgi:hypothetical protein